VAASCRAVIDRCREAKNEHRSFVNSFSGLIDTLQRELDSLPITPAVDSKASTLSASSSTKARRTPVASGRTPFVAEQLELALERTSLAALISSLQTALTAITKNNELEEILENIAQVRKKLENEENVFYNNAGGCFEKYFKFSSDLRTMTTKAELCSRELFVKLKLCLLKLARSHMTPTFALFNTDLASHTNSSEIQEIYIPTIAHMVDDIINVCKVNSHSWDFGQVVLDYEPPKISESAYAGIVSAKYLASADSVVLDKGEIVQVLAKLHGFLLVKRCAIADPKINVGLIPSAVVKHYRVRHQQAADASAAQANSSVGVFTNRDSFPIIVN
jgi:hypothetical protein